MPNPLSSLYKAYNHHRSNTLSCPIPTTPEIQFMLLKSINGAGHEATVQPRVTFVKVLIRKRCGFLDLITRPTTTLILTDHAKECAVGAGTMYERFPASFGANWKFDSLKSRIAPTFHRVVQQ